MPPVVSRRFAVSRGTGTVQDQRGPHRFAPPS
jgi:hypothetical protein